MNCPYCNQDIGPNPQTNFCPECGHRFVRCLKCGDIITKQVKFCPKDGARIPEELLGELPLIVAASKAAASGQQPNYNKQPNYNQQPNYYQQPNYNQQPGYNQQPNYNKQPNYNQQPTYTRRNNPPEPPKKSSSNYILFGVLAVVLVACLGVGSFVVTNKLITKKNNDAQIAADLQNSAAAKEDTSVTETAQTENAKTDTQEEVKIDIDAPSEDTNNTVDEEPTQTEPEEKPKKKDPSTITASVSKAKKSSYSDLKKAKITYSTSSSVVTDNDPSIRNEAAQMVDGDPITSWQEGVPGDGIGENVYFEFKKEYNVKYITFKMGNWRDQDRYNKNNRPRNVLLELGGQEYELSFPDGMTEYMVKFSDGLPASDLYLEIRSVYKGYEWDDTCISEMTVYTE